MTTPCTRLATLLSQTPEAGKALATLEAGLAAHAADCTTCQAELATAQRLVDGITNLHGDFEPPSNLAAVALQRAAESRTVQPVPVKAATTSARPVRGYAIAGLFGAAAATAAVMLLQPGTKVGEDPRVAGAGGELRPVLGPAKVNEQKPAADAKGLAIAACLGDGGETSCDIGRELETAIGETRAFRLSDGTTLQVDQDSKLTFDATRRALTVVRGDAFLDVAHREDLDPLIVTLPTGAVQVLGTELEVRAGQALSVVDVVRGVVAVNGLGVGDGDGEARVKAGQTAWLRAGKKPLVKTSTGAASPGRDWGRKRSDTSDEAYANLGFGSIRARRPGASADADKPLRLVDHLVDVRVQGAFAKTTIEESFASEEANELEGIYRFTLPPGAQVAEMALMVDGRWEEGGFVERDRADKIWAGVIRNATPIIKRREIIEYIWVPGPWRDPALLSMKQGNTFELRIFPIPARGERRVRIAYTESLPLVTGGRKFVLPLPSEGANARAERFSFAMKIGTTVDPSDLRVRNYTLSRTVGDGQITLTNEARGFRAKGDLVVEVPDLAAAEDLLTTAWGKAVSKDDSQVGGGDGADATLVDGYVAFSLRPELAAINAEKKPLDVVVIADTSYGMQKVRLERSALVLTGIVAGLDDEDRVQVLACATTCRSLGGMEKASESLARDLGARLATLEPLGATRLSAAFEAAAKALGDTPAERRRIVYLGDGVQTVGELDPARIVEGVRAVVGDMRITSVGLGGETDGALLGGLAKDHAGSFIDFGSIDSVAGTVAMVLMRQHGEPLRDVELVLPDGLVEMAPARFGDLWPGEERLVTARSAGSGIDGEVVLRGTLGGEPVERRWKVAAAIEEAAGNAYVPRLWAERRIADLSARDDLGTKAEIVKISQAHHVLSRHTSLLVLESPAMAKAFDVRATRAVADWTGELAARTESGELTVESGAMPESEADPSDARDALAASTLDAPAKDLETLSKAPRAGAVSDEVGGNAGFGVTGDSDRWKEDKAIVPPPVRTREMPPSWDRGRGGEWVPMKKVWFKEAVISEHSDRASIAAADERELEARERKLEDEPESRERTMALVRWHMRMHATERAEKLTERWLDKDRMDPEALVALADIAALRGDLERSKALLSSAVEADPQRPLAHLRMARLYEAAGEVGLACEHRLSQALVARSDAAAQAAAVRCGAREARVLAGLEEKLRAKVERSLEREPKPVRISGPFRLDASWDAQVDVDLVVVSPQGRVVSWQGGADLSADEVASLTGEKLTFKGSDNGRWQVFVVRHDEGDHERVEGTLRVTAHGATRRIPFVIGDDESAVSVADIDVAAKFRWERAQP